MGGGEDFYFIELCLGVTLTVTTFFKLINNICITKQEIYLVDEVNKNSDCRQHRLGEPFAAFIKWHSLVAYECWKIQLVIVTF